ncbi:MAG TPA: hypothetical protein VNT20_01790 [Flavisolibacter sp.]|jgi:hypothetical protein|nr:hypothetical protein [Flavisolibacter sp.]
MKTMHYDAVLGQCIYESRQWARLIAFLLEENAFCKARLAEVVAIIGDDASFMKAEEFNEQFLSQDSMFEFLSNELKKHNKLLDKELYIDGESLKRIMKSQRILDRNIKSAEDIFSKTKRRFTLYLLSLL